MDRDRAERVGRAGGVVAADVPVQRADNQPVGLEQTDQDELHPVTARRLSLPSACVQAPVKSSGSRAGTVAAAGRARITTSARSVEASWAPARWRSRRLTRLRVTAFPTALDTTVPTRVDDVVPGATYSTRVGRPARTPERVTRPKSLVLRSRAAAFSTSSPGSGRELGATLGPPGRQDRPSSPGPHPQTKAVGTTAAPVTRLEGALAHGRTPKIVMVKKKVVDDLPTVRGPAKPVKPAPGPSSLPAKTALTYATRRPRWVEHPVRVAWPGRGC